MPQNKTNSAVFSKSGKSYHMNDKLEYTNVIHLDIMYGPCDHVIVWYARVKHQVIADICTKTDDIECNAILLTDVQIHRSSA